MLAFAGPFTLFLLLAKLFCLDGGNPFFFRDRFTGRIVAADEVEVNVNVLLATIVLAPESSQPVSYADAQT